MSPAELVKCISQTKQMLSGIGLGSLKVGTADSWNLWVNGANVDVIRASDIVLANAFSVRPHATLLYPPLSPNHRLMILSTGKAKTSTPTQPTPSWTTSCKP